MTPDTSTGGGRDSFGPVGYTTGTLSTCKYCNRPIEFRGGKLWVHTDGSCGRWPVPAPPSPATPDAVTETYSASSCQRIPLTPEMREQLSGKATPEAQGVELEVSDERTAEIAKIYEHELDPKWQAKNGSVSVFGALARDKLKLRAEVARLRTENAQLDADLNDMAKRVNAAMKGTP